MKQTSYRKVQLLRLLGTAATERYSCTIATYNQRYITTKNFYSLQSPCKENYPEAQTRNTKTKFAPVCKISNFPVVSVSAGPPAPHISYQSTPKMIKLKFLQTLSKQEFLVGGIKAYV